MAVVTVSQDYDVYDLIEAVPDDKKPDIILKKLFRAKREMAVDVGVALGFLADIWTAEGWKWSRSMPSWSDMLTKIELTPQAIRQYQLGYAALVKEGVSRPIPGIEALAKALEIGEAREKPLVKHGEIGRGRSNRGTGGTSNRGGNPTYLLRRLSRDHPELLDKLESGEIASVRKAAIAAGIIKPPSDLTLAKRAYRKLTEQDRQRFCEWLEEPGRSRQSS